MEQPSSKPCRILAFNSLKRLVAIYHSIYAAAKAVNTHSQSIYYASTGVCMSCKGMYYRTLPDDIEITLDDLGVLRLEEYDQLCGVERKIYETKNMTRVGMKYNKKPKTPKL